MKKKKESKIIEAIEFYANPENWAELETKSLNNKVFCIGMAVDAEIRSNGVYCGKIARDALQVWCERSNT